MKDMEYHTDEKILLVEFSRWMKEIREGNGEWKWLKSLQKCMKLLDRKEAKEKTDLQREKAETRSNFKTALPLSLIIP